MFGRKLAAMTLVGLLGTFVATTRSATQILPGARPKAIARIADGSPSNSGGLAAVHLETLTNGYDADAPPGPFILVGEDVTWTYLVTNTGEVTLENIGVSDDRGVIVDCPGSTLGPGLSMECSATGVAIEGYYANVGSVEGIASGVGTVTDQDPSHYFGADPTIRIEKLVNGVHVDEAPGPMLVVGDPVMLDFIVENTGNLVLTDVAVHDGELGTIACPFPELGIGDAMICTNQLVVSPGAHDAFSFVVADSPSCLSPLDIDGGHYFGAAPSVDLEVYVNGHATDWLPGPWLPIGWSLRWVYVVANTGNVPLSGINVSEQSGISVSCPSYSLEPAQWMMCDGWSFAEPGQFGSTATVHATPAGLPPVTNQHASHYYGVEVSVDIQTLTNGIDADEAPGPALMVSDPVTWTYSVTNTGDSPLGDITVSDDHGVLEECPASNLQAGGLMTCTASGAASVGQYRNSAIVTATGSEGKSVWNADLSHYLGMSPDIKIDVLTNGHDADEAPGPALGVGRDVTWTYIIVNTGTIGLSSVSVSDSMIGAVSCPQSTLEPHEMMLCHSSGTVGSGQYANLATVGASFGGDSLVTNGDTSHYVGMLDCNFDCDASGRVDLKDFAAFQEAFIGP